MDRKAVEKEFHDKLRKVADDHHVTDTRWSPEMEKTIRSNPLWVNMKYYAVERKSRDAVLAWYEKHTPGKVVLDYCCGNGEDGVLIAEKWADRVLGIDISEVSIENCRRLAESRGVSDRVIHEVRDAENTGLPSDSFDIITEYGSLHHLDLDKAFAEMARLLKPGGRAICQEALAHNPLIHAYRKLTPDLRTPWEVDHILRRSSLETARRYFGSVQVWHFHLVSLLAVPFRRTPLFKPVLATLEAVDGILLKIPGLRWQAWQMVFELSEPRKVQHS